MTSLLSIVSTAAEAALVMEALYVLAKLCSCGIISVNTCSRSALLNKCRCCRSSATCCCCASACCAAAVNHGHTHISVVQFDRTLNLEQKRIDFRPPEDLPPPLDRPTDACLFGTALLTAAAKAVQQVLRGSNCAAVLTEVSWNAAAAAPSLSFVCEGGFNTLDDARKSF